MVNASQVLDKLGTHPILDLREQFQETEIGRILLTIAVTVRNTMDQNPSRSEYRLQGVDNNVGTLFNKSKESTLTFRESCNKLIHCLSINFHYKARKPRRGMALTPLVHLYGTKGTAEWKATIDINRFIDVATSLT